MILFFHDVKRDVAGQSVVDSPFILEKIRSSDVYIFLTYMSQVDM
jgi:hypothetical protein